ncbi:MAG TPA: hypothetical protein V6C97_15845 [Oculatellaceae cyanobacterium]
MEKEKVRRSILITQSGSQCGITPYAKKLLEEAQSQYGYIIERFEENELLINVCFSLSSLFSILLLSLDLSAVLFVLFCSVFLIFHSMLTFVSRRPILFVQSNPIPLSPPFNSFSFAFGIAFSLSNPIQSNPIQSNLFV